MENRIPNLNGSPHPPSPSPSFPADASPQQQHPQQPQPQQQPPQQSVRILVLPTHFDGMRLAAVLTPDMPPPPAGSEHAIWARINDILASNVAQELLRAVQSSALPCAVDVRDTSKLAAWQAGTTAVMQALEQQVRARCARVQGGQGGAG